MDKLNPADQNATITFFSYTTWFVIKEWNNIEIDKQLHPNWIPVKYRTTLTVPAGNNAFTFDLNVSYTTSSGGIVTYEFKDIEMRYNFEPGRKYQIRSRRNSLGLFRESEIFVQLYDTTEREILLREWKIGQTRY